MTEDHARRRLTCSDLIDRVYSVVFTFRFWPRPNELDRVHATGVAANQTSRQISI